MQSSDAAFDAFAPERSWLTIPERVNAVRIGIRATILDEIRRIENGECIGNSRLQKNLRPISTSARQLDSRAERFVILIKDVWAETPEAQSFHPESGVPSLLSRIVTAALRILRNAFSSVTLTSLRIFSVAAYNLLRNAQLHDRL